MIVSLPAHTETKVPWQHCHGTNESAVPPRFREVLSSALMLALMQQLHSLSAEPAIACFSRKTPVLKFICRLWALSQPMEQPLCPPARQTTYTLSMSPSLYRTGVRKSSTLGHIRFLFSGWRLGLVTRVGDSGWVLAVLAPGSRVVSCTLVLFPLFASCLVGLRNLRTWSGGRIFRPGRQPNLRVEPVAVYSGRVGQQNPRNQSNLFPPILGVQQNSHHAYRIGAADRHGIHQSEENKQTLVHGWCSKATKQRIFSVIVAIAVSLRQQNIGKI